MSQENHVESLKRKHEALDRQVEEMQASPATDSLDLQSVKRRKLELKDQISRSTQ
ncbi:YdcH family protein [Pseudosulfitobacter pseudonitzschiae]|uniref:YdcH family protein n=1 Tax=Pseudosulfitobacter pseudonitzschiae TaxID=1402135 RepID=UPI003B34B7C6